MSLNSTSTTPENQTALASPQWTRSQFLAWEMASRDCIDVKRCYIDMAGDLVTGVLLSQILYWHLPDKAGHERLRIIKDGQLWLAKGRADWWDECRITPKQFDRAAEVLETKGLIERRVMRFQGNPTVHLHLNWKAFLLSLTQTLMPEDAPPEIPPPPSPGPSAPVIPQTSITNLPKGKFRSSQKVKNQIDLSANSLTESVAETKTESIDKDLNPFNVTACTASEDGKVSSADFQTLNGSSECQKTVLLTKQQAQRAHEVMQLTADHKSQKRYEQLASITDQAHQWPLWDAACAATRARLHKTQKPLDAPGAYFCSILTRLLRSEGVYAPIGTPQERNDIRTQIRQSLAQADAQQAEQAQADARQKRPPTP